MKKVLLLFFTVTALGVFAQNVNIPDVNFKAYLVGDPAINTNSDSEIQVTEAQSFTGVINCVSMGIADMTGLEAFTGITTLYCNDNAITSIDLSANTALTYLYCTYNSLTSLDISNNMSLAYIDCRENEITSLNLGTITSIIQLNCRGNFISSLDLSNNSMLTELDCESNNLTTLDLTSNTNLSSLNCSFNSITTLNLSQNIYLNDLNCRNNQLNSLDLSANTNLMDLICRSNVLTSLNVANGNNTNMTSFVAQANPLLTCIEVDDEAWSTSNWINIDAASSFSEDCTAGLNEVTIIGSFDIYPNPATSAIHIETSEKIEEITIVNQFGQVMLKTNLSEINIQDFPAGIYFVNVKTAHQQLTNRLIKQ